MKYCINCRNYRADNEDIFQLEPKYWCSLDETITSTPIKRVVHRGTNAQLIKRNKDNNCANFVHKSFTKRLFSFLNREE